MLGKVALITGASSGIGAGIAVHLASKGCLLALTGRSLEGLEETRRSCVAAGSREQDLLVVPADLLAEGSLSNIVGKTTGKFRKLDILVNNAGLSKTADLERTSLENYDIIMNTNLRAPFFLTQLALPHLLASKGCVVNVSSLGAKSVNRKAIAYCMSKAALDHFTRNAAVDLAPKGVRVNAVNPGLVRTPFIEKVGSRNYEDVAKKRHAMERDGTVEEVAKAVAFLADGEQSSFVTGVTLLVDGGAYLKGPL